MESTGGTTANTKADTTTGNERVPTIPKDHYRYIPSIQE